MEKRINGEIFGYIVQILVIIVFMVASYFIFTNSRISQFASTAAAYDNMKFDLSISYSKDSEAILNSANTLDKGTISIKNPNKKDALSTLYMYVREEVNLDQVEFIVDGNAVDTANAKLEDGYYVFQVYEGNIGAYEKKYIDSEIKGNAFYVAPFTYKFDVQESFL